jgi:hypothetical protein
MLKYTVSKKILCIVCNQPMTRIVYGLMTKDLYEVAEKNGWLVGGCTPSPITNYCKDCNVSWSKDLGFDEPTLNWVED